MYESFISERIAKLRTQKGVSARDMSLSLGVANNYINNIENKKALPSMQAFFSICEYLGVTPLEFFDEGNQNPKAMRKFIKEGMKLSPDNLALILSLMKQINGKKK
ncbi:MAG: helix-turn-helix domain-containing protein [Clostridiales bacterium]|nr:helix-turn-helix domain-containing protein [Clostridiales bacterium]